MLTWAVTLRRAFWLMVVLTLAASSASAAPRPGRGRALELFEKSARAYGEGRFQDAIDLLVEARRVKKEPVLLYNLGRAYEAIGRLGDAADAYAEYLREDPRAADRGAIEGRITTLRSQAEQLARAKAPLEEPRLPPAEERSPPTEDRTAADEPPAPKTEAPGLVLPFVVATVGAVGIGTGVALALFADSRHEAAVRDVGQASAQKKQDEAETLATGATIALVAGGAVATAGLTWLGIRAVSKSRSVSLLPGIGALTLRATF